MTNGDCIRQWPDEEIADFIAGVISGTVESICKQVDIDYTVPDELYKQARDEWLAWLKQEAGSDA